MRLLSLTAAAAGAAITLYLTYVFYQHVDPACFSDSQSCSAVQKSKYSEVLGVPLALIGAIGYLLIFVSLLLPIHKTERGRLITLSLSTVGFLFSIYLTYLEIFVLKALCQWCVASAVLLTILFVVSCKRWLDFDATETSQFEKSSTDDNPDS